jgi:hypothetical protein
LIPGSTPKTTDIRLTPVNPPLDLDRGAAAASLRHQWHAGPAMASTGPVRMPLLRAVVPRRPLHRPSA